MSTFEWIVAGGAAMSAIALVGSVAVLLDERTLDRIILPLVAFAAGTLLGGALFHMLPAAVATQLPSETVFLWVFVGFVAFYVLEQFLHWHHFHRTGAPAGGGERSAHHTAAETAGTTRAGDDGTGTADTADARPRPVTYLVLIGDGVHNFLGGLAVGGAFVADVQVGLAAWLVAAAHEVPQEIGDFGVLVHGGWSRRSALLFNFVSALGFPLGALLAYAASFAIDVAFLLPLAAGNFIYIAASDLIPEIKGHFGAGRNLVNLVAFVTGAGLLYVLAVLAG